MTEVKLQVGPKAHKKICEKLLLALHQFIINTTVCQEREKAEGLHNLIEIALRQAEVK